MVKTLREIAGSLGFEYEGDGDLVISGVAALGKAREGDLSFMANPKYLRELATTKASAVVLPPGVETTCPGVIRADNPYYAFSKAVWMFAPKPDIPVGVMQGATVDPSAEIGEGATVFPNAFVAPGARVGRRSILYPGVYLGHGSSVGDDCIVYPNVVIREGVRIGDRVLLHGGAVIGADGFGFVTEKGKHNKIPQVGGVVIEDDVEVGANTAIDRGALGDTIVRKGTKIDNLVQVAHNVKVGEDCLIAAQGGISGSTELGHHVVLAGQVGVVGHIRIGDGVQVGAKSGVTKNLKDWGGYTGIPARDHKDWLKVSAVMSRLPEIKKEVAELGKKLDKFISDED